MAQGAEVGFHHVFDFTVTRVVKNEEAWKDGQKLAVRGHAARRQARQGRSSPAARPPAFPFKIFWHLGLVEG
jgi:hypothetical protein